MEARTKEDLTLLGNRRVRYETDYNPGVLETFETAIRTQGS